ncbi:hypothetical protein TNCV_279801 [Trichonephila clavipes]|nr:hypothetical protein TNCV_279801 [Trichonephila clavipes]
MWMRLRVSYYQIVITSPKNDGFPADDFESSVDEQFLEVIMWQWLETIREKFFIDEKWQIALKRFDLDESHGKIVEEKIVGVAIYRPFGEFRRANSYCHLYGAQGLGRYDRRTSSPLPR